MIERILKHMNIYREMKSCPNFPMKRLRKYWQIKKSRTGLYMFI